MKAGGDKQARNGQHRRGGEHHEADHHAEGDPARARRGACVARAEGMTDPHRRRLGDPERDHEGERDDLEYHRMRLERGRADQPHQQREGREDRGFEHDRRADRRAKPPELDEGNPIEAPRAGEEAVTGEMRIDQGVDHHYQQHEALRDEGRDP